MSKPKVYLAKSNRSNPDLVTRVRQILSSYDIEIVEFSGGQYSHKPLKECEYLVVIPDLSTLNISYGDYIVEIGKGLCEQLDYFSENNEAMNIIIISDNDLSVREINTIEITNENDYINYASIFLEDEDDISFKQVCKNIFGDIVINTSEFSYKYLLRKRK
jgi:hypothetical protein